MSAPQQPQPSQEELEAYFNELRQAPVHDLLLQAFSVLGTGAEVKLGLPDARVLIDSMEALLGAGRVVLEETAAQLEQAIVQLKTAQVQAEKEIAAEQAGEGQGEGQPAESGQAQAATPPPAAPQQPQQKATDKLWIPGQG
ncbi:MAG: hypothetical protein ABGZ36_23925 [Actinomycetota bacterium]|jgi:hypothetical protein